MLKVVNLTCGYEKRIALSDINFQINSGEFLGIIGPNGSGKTTLLRAISRVIIPIDGEILWEGRDIQTMPAKELARDISVVSQNPSLNNLTVEEFILLGRIPYYGAFQFFEAKRDLEAARKAMDLTGTLSFKDRVLSKMSGGEKQLVLVARALAQKPKLLLLDEPTAHLDITHQVSILDLIRRLNRDLGLIVIMVLHDLNLAGEYCNRLLLIDKGRIHRIGLPGEIFNYRDIEEIYKTKVLIENNPVSLKPYILLVSEEGRKRLR
jgi:iron complex transport system ATP-binding protein